MWSSEASKEEHDLARRDPAQLWQPGGLVGPVVDGEHGERGVEGSVGKGERLGHAADGERGAAAPLADHLG